MKNIFLVLMFALLATACGNNTDSSSEGTTDQMEEKAPQSEMDASGEAKVELTGNDQMQYDKKEIKVKAGQKVTLTLTHIGKMSKDVMGHNFVLLKPGTDMAAFAQQAMAAKDNDYIPEDSSSIIVHTKVLGGGESDTITFDAPAPGTYDYICSFPGHYALMQGKFIVE
ncbi:MAG: azurin [Saprospiraceae bacterium]